MIFLIVLMATLGLVLFIFLKPKPTGRSHIAFTANLDPHTRTTEGSFSEEKKHD